MRSSYASSYNNEVSALAITVYWAVVTHQEWIHENLLTRLRSPPSKEIGSDVPLRRFGRAWDIDGDVVIWGLGGNDDTPRELVVPSLVNELTVLTAVLLVGDVGYGFVLARASDGGHT